MIKIIPVLLLLITSCSPLTMQRESYVQDYQRADFEAVDEKISNLIERTSTNEQVWLKLDRGLERLITGNTDLAIGDFNQALDTLDYFNQTSLAETFGQILFCDASAPYRGDDFEQLLARIYFAFALLQEKDISNAHALLRQAEEWTLSKKEEYLHSPVTENFFVTDNRIGRALFGTLLEHEGDESNADILFKQADLPPHQKKDATLLVISHNGQIAKKVSAVAPGSQASMLALELLVAPQNRQAICSLSGIPVPRLVSRPNPYAFVTASLDGCEAPFIQLLDVEHVACTELAQKEPLIIARGLARLAARRAAAYAAGGHDKDAGQMIDLGMLILNLATLADTRAWSLLPKEITMARFDLDAGEHLLDLAIEENSISGNFSKTFFVKKGDLLIVHIFNIYPGNTQILFPQI